MNLTMRPITKLPNTKDTGFTVEYTDDLGIFQKLDGNRDLVPGHVDMLSRAMSKRVLFSPLYVNDDMAVLDGQHRLASLERRNMYHSAGLGTHYIQFKGLGYDAAIVPVYNTNAVNWKTNDYIDAYCSKGVESFVRLRMFMRYTNTQLGIGGAANIPSTTPFSTGLAMILLAGKEDLAAVKNGTLVLTQEQVNNATRTFDALLDMKNGGVKVWKQKKFVIAFKQFVGKSYNRSRMVNQLMKWQGDDFFSRQPKVDGYREKIAEFYNA